MAKNRRQIFVKGLGNLWVRQIDPVVETAFTDVGFLQDTKFTDAYDMEEIKDEAGNYIDTLEHGQTVTIETNLLQSAKAQIDFKKNAAAQYHAVRYEGMESVASYKYFCMEQARLIPGADLDFKPTLRKVPLMVKALKQVDPTFNIPMYHLIEATKRIYADSINLWIEPRYLLNTSTNRILDASGFGYHGTLSADYATMWQTGSTPTGFLRFDGANDVLDFGDVCDVADTTDFGIEFWVRIQGANASLQEILSKKAADAHEAGYRFVRTTGNKIAFKLSDGAASATFTSTSNVLINVWTKVGIYVDRTGNAQMFINGVADGSPVDFSGVGNADCADTLQVAQFAGGFGQVDIGGLRIHLYGVDSLPADFATREASHFAGERDFYGV